MLLKEAAELYSALDMKPTAYFAPPEDGIKVRLVLLGLQRDPHVPAAYSASCSRKRATCLKGGGGGGGI